MHRPSLLASLLLLGCTTPESPPAVESESSEYFFAVLGQSGVEHCPDGKYEPTWLDVQTNLGFVPAGGVDPKYIEPLMDQPVLAYGNKMPAPPRDPISIATQECPPMQMRMDWVNTPRGIRVRRDDSPKIDYFHISRVRRLDELRVIRDGNELLVEFENPLGASMRDVQLVMHYEGCYAKPGSTSIASEATDLATGSSISHRFPLLAERDQADHRASELVLRIGGSRDGTPIYADLSVSLSEFGVAFECP